MKKAILFLLALICVTSASVCGAQTAEFDLQKGTVMLNSGYEMPVLGIGCFALSDQQAENSVYWALRDGYRLIDTARIYGNEPGVGRAIRRAMGLGQKWAIISSSSAVRPLSPMISLVVESSWIR